MDGIYGESVSRGALVLVEALLCFGIEIFMETTGEIILVINMMIAKTKSAIRTGRFLSKSPCPSCL